MSFRYGTNGNDLNWDMVMSLYQYCLTCEEIKFEIKQKIKAIVEEYFTRADNLIDSFINELMSEHAYCEGHIWLYSPVKLDFDKLIQEGRTIEEIVPWAIFHDTNNNFVSLYGDVPDDYLTPEYIQERDEYLRANGLL